MASVYDPTTAPVKLAPSDLTFLWDECKRCFWMKVRGNLRRPSAPFPKIFTKLDQQTKDYFFGKPTQDMADGLRPGHVAFASRWVRSRSLFLADHKRPVVLAGKIDTALAFDDGSFAIIDFKTSDPKSEHVPFYGRQLQSYAIAAENAEVGALELSPVSQLGLLCVEPVAMVGLEDDVAFKTKSHFLEIPRDDDAFTAFLSQVLFVLERPEPPEASPNCGYCSYLATGAMTLITGMHDA